MYVLLKSGRVGKCVRVNPKCCCCDLLFMCELSLWTHWDTSCLYGHGNQQAIHIFRQYSYNRRFVSENEKGHDDPSFYILPVQAEDFLPFRALHKEKGMVICQDQSNKRMRGAIWQDQSKKKSAILLSLSLSLSLSHCDCEGRIHLAENSYRMPSEGFRHDRSTTKLGGTNGRVSCVIWDGGYSWDNPQTEPNPPVLMVSVLDISAWQQLSSLSFDGWR